MNKFTEEDAKSKFCPIISKHCVTKKCMMFVFVGNYDSPIYDKKKPLNKPKIEKKAFYACALSNKILQGRYNESSSTIL